MNGELGLHDGARDKLARPCVSAQRIERQDRVTEALVNKIEDRCDRIDLVGNPRVGTGLTTGKLALPFAEMRNISCS